MRPRAVLMLGVLALPWTQCAHNPVAPAPRELTALEKRLVQSDNGFGLKLFRAVNAAEPGENLFVSPLSVSMALGMTLNGASGETQQAMRQTLEFDGMTTEEINQSYRSLIELLTRLDPKVAFQIANSIWYREGFTFEEAFLRTNQTYFDAVVQALNFDDPAAKDVINRWVRDNTNGKIQEIVDRIDPEMVMFLINAIYFNGTWTFEFDKTLTDNDLFTRPDGSQSQVKMMHLTGDLDYFETAAFQAVDLHYVDGRFTMRILLPRTSAAVDSLVAALDQDNWASWMGRFSTQAVKLDLPRFELEVDVGLKEILRVLGMGIAFEPGLADFSNMYKGPEDLFISKVKHKTYVKVDEEGTEAAAVTSVGIGATSIGEGAIEMRVDHPFLFVIREKHSGTILFVGKMVDPPSIPEG